MMRTTPNEVLADAADPKAYARVALEKDDIRRPYTLPSAYCGQLYEQEPSDMSDCPLIVFVNSRSGGRKGSDLTLAFQRHLGRLQVFDLSKNKPDTVLRRLWKNFDDAVAAGDAEAEGVRRRTRLLVAGGDGTIAWVLGTIKELHLEPEPPVAIIPLGTGNDLSRSFGWGGAYDAAWIANHRSMYNTLRRIAVARPETMDCWHVRISLPQPRLMSRLPYSLSNAGECQSGGMFWNYFSVGLDAKAAHGFHELRESKPWLTAGRMMNQAAYMFYSCSSGWFCCAKSVTSKVKLQAVMPGQDDWTDVRIPSTARALVVLNLQSYAGGRNLWGTERDSAFSTASFNDGLVDVVGLSNGYHTGCVMATKGDLVHAQRVVQAKALRLHLAADYLRSDGLTSNAYLQVDGEPWRQGVPHVDDGEPLMIEVTHAGTSKLLTNGAGLNATRLRKPYEDALKVAGESLMSSLGAGMLKAPDEFRAPDAAAPAKQTASGIGSKRVGDAAVSATVSSVAATQPEPSVAGTEATGFDSDWGVRGSAVPSSPGISRHLSGVSRQ